MNDYNTVCPRCGEDGQLFVTEVTLTSHQLVIQTYIRLFGDGFDCSPDVPEELLESDLSTQDEEVTCEACHETFSLHEVM